MCKEWNCCSTRIDWCLQSILTSSLIFGNIRKKQQKEDEENEESNNYSAVEMYHFWWAFTFTRRESHLPENNKISGIINPKIENVDKQFQKNKLKQEYFPFDIHLTATTLYKRSTTINLTTVKWDIDVYPKQLEVSLFVWATIKMRYRNNECRTIFQFKASAQQSFLRKSPFDLRIKM